MRCQNVNTLYVLVTAEPLKQIIQIFAIQRSHQPLAKVAGLLRFSAKGATPFEKKPKGPATFASG